MRFRGPALGYWDTYIAAPAMLINGMPVDFVLADGAPAWTYNLSGRLPEDLVSPHAYGIATKDQRFGSALAAAQGFAFAGVLGFRLTFCLCVALLPPLTLLVWRRSGGSGDWPGVVAGLWLACNPLMLATDRLNPSVFALPLLLAVIALVVDAAPRGALARAAVAGLALGLCASMREEAVCFVPALGAWLLWGRAELRGQRWKCVAVFGTACVVAMAPSLAWKAFVFGDPLMHPSQYDHHDGWRPTFPHQFLGVRFAFNGLLNWPFAQEWVRTPHFAFPVVLLWPLTAIVALGMAGVGLVGAGWWRLRRRSPDLAWLCVGWVVPLYALFGPQENWEEVKMTFLLLAFPAVALPLGEGLVAAVAGISALRLRWTWLCPPALRAGLASGAVATVVVLACRTVDVPADPRWYVRFPNADVRRNPVASRELAQSERGDWTFFQRADHPAELARERARLTRWTLWPATYLPARWSWHETMQQTAAEAGARRWKVLDVWGYIYGARRWPSG